MRGAGERSYSPSSAADGSRSTDWRTLARLLPYLWQYRWRVGAALLFVIGAKMANVAVPVLLKHLVDAMTVKPGDPAALLVVPVGLLVAYGALRVMTTVFTELRELVFSKATQGASRQIALQTFEHLHALSLRFHLGRVNTNGDRGDCIGQSRAWRSRPHNSPPLSIACPSSVATSA